MKKNIIYLFLTLILILVVVFTWQIIDWTNDSVFLSIDFKNKYDEIQAYSGIIGFLLSFLSIIFVIYTIVEQREYFKKNINLKEQDEKKLRKDFIEFSNFYLNDVIKNTNEFGLNIHSYSKDILSNPLRNINLVFSITNNNKRFADIDNLQLFKSFTENFINGSKLYNDFLKYTDFYIEAKSELKLIYQSHSSEKYEKKKELAFKLDDVMDLCSTLIEKYREDYPTIFNQKKWYNLINNLIYSYYNQINPDVETDLVKLDKEVLLPFLTDAQLIRNEDGFEFNIQDIVLKVAKTRKLLYSLVLDCQIHGAEFQNVYNKYFTEDSETLKKITDLQIEMTNNIH